MLKNTLSFRLDKKMFKEEMFKRPQKEAFFFGGGVVEELEDGAGKLAIFLP